MTPFQEKVLKFLNKDYNKNTLGRNFDFNSFGDIMLIARNDIYNDLINHYGVDVNSSEFTFIVRNWCRQNYGDGKYAIAGDTIRLIKMPDDPNPIKPGTVGVVKEVSFESPFNEDHLDVDWENGRSLKLIVGLDEFERIKDSVK
jgi:hypothetical protein